jgi:hypothetical protein
MKTKLTKELTYWMGMIAIGLIFGSVIQFAVAWSEPSGPPPSGNVGSPLNTGANTQTKYGNLIINMPDPLTNTYYTSGLLVPYGNVGLGVAAPTTALEVAQNKAIKVGNAYISSGGDYMHLSNNEWYNGAGSWITNGSAGALIQLAGQGVNFYKHDAAGNHTSTANLDANGNFTAAGNICAYGGSKCIGSGGGGGSFLGMNVPSSHRYTHPGFGGMTVWQDYYPKDVTIYNNRIAVRYAPTGGAYSTCGDWIFYFGNDEWTDPVNESSGCPGSEGGSP